MTSPRWSWTRSAFLFHAVTRLQQLKKEVLALSDSERAALVAQLLASLPGVLAEEDGGVAEALRREAEMNAIPSVAISVNELKRRLAHV